MTEVEKAYLAGFFDGEGCIYIAKQRNNNTPNLSYHIQIIVSQNDYEFLKYWRDKVNMGAIYQRKDTDETPESWKPNYQWRMSAKNAEIFLLLIIDYLTIKKEQAQIALELRNTKIYQAKRRGERIPAFVLEKRERLYQLMKEAKRGVDVESGLEEIEDIQSPQMELF